MPPVQSLASIHQEILRCNACPRLRKHCEKMSKLKRKAYADEEYWGKPITGFGDSRARLLIVGLAPAAHGANRTGRIFTGDRSGDWLYRALHKAGFANQALSRSRDDGLKLRDAYISCVVKCAPPDNKPSPAEIKRCIPYLEEELAALPRARVFVSLGLIGLAGIWPMIGGGRPRPKLNHGESLDLGGGRWLIHSYHPSQQNTFTGRLTEPMFDRVFSQARQILG
jgi:uracil-DNA glycosylase family 4